MKRRRVRVVPHDPASKRAFEAEADALRSVLGGEALAIRHIGSTYVPNRRAKPPGQADDRRPHRSPGDRDPGRPRSGDGREGVRGGGEYGIPGRRFFTRARGPDRLCNVHGFEAGTPEVERHLAFRDYLTPQPETARSYGDLKGDLAERFPADMEAYMNGKDTFMKDTFIIRVEREAHSWGRNRHEAS
jgi:GrpB-like predicted nucleotidyltransferase (UPF0157 family)